MYILIMILNGKITKGKVYTSEYEACYDLRHIQRVADKNNFGTQYAVIFEEEKTND